MPRPAQPETKPRKSKTMRGKTKRSSYHHGTEKENKIVVENKHTDTIPLEPPIKLNRAQKRFYKDLRNKLNTLAREADGYAVAHYAKMVELCERKEQEGKLTFTMMKSMITTGITLGMTEPKRILMGRAAYRLKSVDNNEGGTVIHAEKIRRMRAKQT